MELNEYVAMPHINATANKKEKLYPSLDDEFPDETHILERVSPSPPPQPARNLNATIPQRPSPAPRSSLKSSGDSGSPRLKPIPRPRQRLQKTASKLVDNPVYFDVTLQEEEDERVEVGSGDGIDVTIRLRMSVDGTRDSQPNPEVVLEFDPLAPGKCPMLEEQRRLKLTNSVFYLDGIKEGQFPRTCHIDREHADEERDSVSVSLMETTDCPSLDPNTRRLPFEQLMGLAMAEEPESDILEHKMLVSENCYEEIEDDSGSESVDMEPPKFPPPPLPDGFSASTLSLSDVGKDDDSIGHSENSMANQQPLPPPRYAILQPPGSPDKPALPPKMGRCQTPDGGTGPGSGSGSGSSSCSGPLSSGVSSRCVSSISVSSDSSLGSLRDKVPPAPPKEAIKSITSNVDQSVAVGDCYDDVAPPLPPKSKAAARTRSWNFVDMVRSRILSNYASRHGIPEAGRSGSPQLMVGGKDRESQVKRCLRGIPFSGFLHKTGSNRKEFRQRWCVLENSHFKYYLDDKSEVPQGAVHQQEILSVGRVMDNGGAKNGPQDMHCFEVCTSKDKGRCYLFGSSTKAEQEGWLEHIVLTIAPETCRISDGNFTKAGYVHLRFGMTGKWQNVWLVLQDKTLTTTCVGEEKSENFDLRKVTSLEMHPADRHQSCPEVVEDGSPFLLDFPGRSLFIQANLRKETDSWYLLLRNTAHSTGESLDSQQLNNDNVPIIVDKCITFVTVHGYSSEGIYRLNGVSSKVTKLLSALKQDARGLTLKTDEYNVHEVANTLKRFFRSLPEPLLTKNLYNQWITCSVMSNEHEKITIYDQLLRQLPEINYCTLKSTIAHLRNISDNSDQNKMTVQNLASIFGPSLLTTERDDSVPNLLNANAEMDVVGDLISNYPVLFKVSPEELKKDIAIQKALMDIKEARKAKKPAGDILIGVYVYSPDWGKTLMVRLSPTLTAKDLCIHAIQSARMKERLECISVFEVVSNGELERPLHHSEVVLAVTLQWARWADAEAKDNYLVIKKNELYHSILPLTRQPISMFSELRFADSKSKHFKKFLLEFKNARLSFYRDIKITQPDGTWNIEDITWYLGCESKRQGPTKWAFTFIDKNDEVKRSKDRPYFGRTICCNTEEEFHKWIAAMLIGEYPNGLVAKREVVDLLS